MHLRAANFLICKGERLASYCLFWYSISGRCLQQTFDLRKAAIAIVLTVSRSTRSQIVEESNQCQVLGGKSSQIWEVLRTRHFSRLSSTGKDGSALRPPRGLGDATLTSVNVLETNEIGRVPGGVETNLWLTLKISDKSSKRISQKTQDMNCLDLERPERGGLKTLFQAFLKSYEQFLFWSSQPSHLETFVEATLDFNYWNWNAETCRWKMPPFKRLARPWHWDMKFKTSPMLAMSEMWHWKSKKAALRK